MVFLEKTKRYIIFGLMGISIVFFTYNGISKINEGKELQKKILEQFENESRKKAQKKFTTIKFLIYTLDGSIRKINPQQKQRSVYHDLLIAQRELRSNYFIALSIGAHVDLAFVEHNKGVNNAESYDLDELLNKYNLKTEDLKTENRVATSDKNLLFTLRGRSKVHYVFTVGEEFLSELVNSELGEWYFDIGDKSYDIHNLKPAPIDVNTFSIFDNELGLGFSFREKPLSTKWILNIVILYIAIPILLSVFLIRLFINKFFNKYYGSISELFSNIEIEDESEEGEIEYIVNYFDQLKSQNNNLKDKVDYMEQSLKEKRIRDHIHGSIPRNTVNDKKDILKGQFKACILNFNSAEFSESLFIIKGELQKALPNSTVINVDNTLYMIIMKSTAAIPKEELIELLAEFYAKYSLEAVGFYSKNVFTEGHLYNSYSYFYKNLDYRFMLDKYVIVNEDDVSKYKGKTYYYPIELEQKWINKYLKGNFQGAKSILNEIFNENFVERKINTKVFETFKILLFNSLKRLDNEEINKYQDEFFDINKPEKLAKSLYSILKEFLPEAPPEQTKNTQDVLVSEKILVFIDKHYTEDISLLDLAEHLGVSLQYASNLHKKVLGENFNQHLNRYRINRAVEILKNDDSVKIKDLALMVGYINTNTFINNFKKIKGVSPGKFIK